MGNPAIGKCVDDGVDRHVGNWNGHRPPREPVDYCEEVLEAVGGYERHKVQIDMLKSFLGNLEISNGGNSVFNHFCPLAMNTFARPFGDILSQ